MKKYRVYIGGPEDDLIVTVTPFSGNPDIYVTRDPDSNFLMSDYKSVNYGNETLAVSRSDREAMGSSTGWYYIGIYGVTHSLYTLKVSLSSESHVPLLPGI